MSDWQQRRCYLCGELGADTGDHTPPKGVLPKGYRHKGEDLIKVPAHTSCNRLWKDDDEYLKVQLAIPAAMGDEVAQTLHEEAMRGLKHPKARGFLTKVDGEFLEGPVVLPDGSVRSDIVARQPDWDRMIRVMERTARGVYYYETHTILPLDWPVRGGVAKTEEVAKLFKDLAGEVHSFASGSFKYIWLHNTKQHPNDRRHAAIFFAFFGKVFFLVELGYLAEIN